MLTTAIAITLLTFIVGSATYVYQFRGTVRYDNLNQYLRKGWPIFAPLNCLLYFFTSQRARQPIMNLAQFDELAEIQKHWQVIREEALVLHQLGLFDATKQLGSASYYDIGFRTFYKYGWSKFYLNWYGYTHDSARQLCPETVKILSRIPAVNGAMFSLLPAGSKLTRHADPVACSMRYHLGLVTPQSDACYINIDGTFYSWRDGEPLLFDETYLHYAHNDADQDRLILMCDVERPVSVGGRVINFFYKRLMRATVVPNLPGDQRGLVNRMFAGLMPILQRSRAMKRYSPARYKLLKYSVNLTLATLVLGMTTGVCVLCYRFAMLTT